jgi:arylsulfatase A-like enzyme
VPPRPALAFALSLAVAGCAARARAPQLAPAAPRAPNIVLVMADDLGWRELGAYGNTFNETPQLDRLASEGVRFSQAYAAAPVCSPTRAALMTGRHPVRAGITDYLRPDDPRFLDPSAATLEKLLRRSGYRTGLIGKWHLGGDLRTRRGGPERFAWDEVLLSESRGVGAGDYFHPYAHLPGVEARSPGEYLTDRINQEAVDFIHRNGAAPFFLYVSHYAPHTKLAGKPDLVARFAQKPGAGQTANNPELAAMLLSIDEGVGRIRATLDELGLGENTILLFTSDNGGEERVTSNAPLRGGKSQLYEGGIRVPLIVRWPRAVRPGSVSDEAVITEDLFATLLDVAGAAREAKAGDGVSLRGVLAGGSLPPRRLTWYYPLDRPHFLGGRSAAALRDGSWKLVRSLETGAAELYDLARDPGEAHDLAGIEPARAAALVERLAEWQRRVGAAPGRHVQD